MQQHQFLYFARTPSTAMRSPARSPRELGVPYMAQLPSRREAKDSARILTLSPSRRGDSRIARNVCIANLTRSPQGEDNRNLRPTNNHHPNFKNCANPSLPPRGRWHFRKKMTEGVSGTKALKDATTATSSLCAYSFRLVYTRHLPRGGRLC